MATAAPGPRLYRSRRPERTLLYRALADQFERFLGGPLEWRVRPSWVGEDKLSKDSSFDLTVRARSAGIRAS